MKKNQTPIRCIRKYKKKDGSFSYHAEVRRRLLPPLRKSFTNLTQAKNWVRATETKLLEGQLPQSEKARKCTLSELLDRYESIQLQQFPERKRSQIHHLNWWRKRYGHKLLVDITAYTLSQAKQELLQEKTNKKIYRTQATANRYLSTLSTVFTLAYKEWELISENPFLKVTKFPETKGRTRFLTKEEFQSLLEECKKSSNSNLYGMVLLAGMLGMRFGEIANLTWKNIDFSNRFITLEITKNKDIRVVPMSDPIYEYLQVKNNNTDPEEFIFPSKDPIKRSPYSMIRKSFKKILQKLGFHDVVFHTLRHTAASHLAMNGATQGELMEILGHRSPVMSKRYTHFNKEHLTKLIQRTSNSIHTEDK